jgi:hypothetical protein
MADIILNIGKSGSGKTSGLRNMPSNQTYMIRPNSKSLPFPGGDKNFIEGKNLYITDAMSAVKSILVQASKVTNNPYKYYVIEDLNHFFNARTTSDAFIAQNAGGAAFSKWNQFAADIIQSFIVVAKNLPADCYLVILAHTEEKDDGTIGMQTSGKLLESNLYIPGYVTYVLHSMITGDAKDPSYVYLTNADGLHLAKSPAGSLEKSMPNDMYKVVLAVDEYKKGTSRVQVKWKE